MEKVIACTIIANNYSEYAQLLAKSYKKHHPDHKFYVLFLDDIVKKSKDYIGIKLTEVDNIPELKEMLFRYDILETSTAVKPFFLEWLLKKDNAEKIFYFDPDIYIYQPVIRLLDSLDTNDCVLVPHVTTPALDDKLPDEWDFVKAGIYNLGFAGFRNSKQTIKYLKWWQDKTYHYGYSDIDNHMFVDQKWMDFAPSYLKTEIVRDKGYDVAYWNLHEYIGKVSANEVVFFHFSGFNYQDNKVSKYQNRHTRQSIGEYRNFYDDYAEKIRSISQGSNKKYRYPYNYFENGVFVAKPLRKIFDWLKENSEKKFTNDPFSIGNKSYYNFLISKLNLNKEIEVPNYAYYLYKSNPSIAQEFPELDFFSNNAGLRNYLKWLYSYGEYEYDLPSKLIEYLPVASGRRSKQNIITDSSLKLILSVERIKRRLKNELFIEKAYKLLLKRYPDNKGFQNNLKDLIQGKSSKNQIIYRLLKSEEFITKHENSIGLIFYKYIIFFLAGIEMPWLMFKNFMIPSENKQTDNVIKPKGIKINIAGYLDTESGVAESARGLIRAAKTKDLMRLNINNIEQEWLRRKDKSLTNEFTSNHDGQINLLCINADQVVHVVKNNLGKKYVNKKYNIGYWYWESDIFPPEYHPAFSQLNEIWVATDYVYNALKIISPIPIVKIPPSFSIPQHKNNIKMGVFSNEVSSKDFVFLNIFDSASFWQRKNPFGLFESFDKAFKGNKKVKLIVKTTALGKNREVYEEVKQWKDKNPNIILLDGYLSNLKMAELMAASQAYISLHRSEGLGIPLIDGMLMGKPVVATAFGGNKDFMNINNSFPVKHQPYILKEAIGPYPEGTNWANPDVDHAAYLMKQIYKDYALALKIAEKGRKDTELYFGPKRVGDLMSQRLKVILK